MDATQTNIPFLAWGYYTAAVRGEAPREFSYLTVRAWVSRQPWAEGRQQRLLEDITRGMLRWLAANACEKKRKQRPVDIMKKGQRKRGEEGRRGIEQTYHRRNLALPRV